MKSERLVVVLTSIRSWSGLEKVNEKSRNANGLHLDVGAIKDCRGGTIPSGNEAWDAAVGICGLSEFSDCPVNSMVFPGALCLSNLYKYYFGICCYCEALLNLSVTHLGKMAVGNCRIQFLFVILSRFQM